MTTNIQPIKIEFVGGNGVGKTSAAASFVLQNPANMYDVEMSNMIMYGVKRVNSVINIQGKPISCEINDSYSVCIYIDIYLY